MSSVISSSLWRGECSHFRWQWQDAKFRTEAKTCHQLWLVGTGQVKRLLETFFLLITIGTGHVISVSTDLIKCVGDFSFTVGADLVKSVGDLLNTVIKLVSLT